MQLQSQRPQRTRSGKSSVRGSSAPVLSPPAPTGRDEIRSAVLKAAADLFAERSPASVSVREIAGRAGINHALVHRHFGTKQDLLAAVLQNLSAEMSSSAAQTPCDESGIVSVFNVAASSPYWRVLARLILDGQAPAELQSEFGVVGHMVEAFSNAQSENRLDAEFDPRTTAAMTVAMGLGWLLFEPFLLPAAGLDERDPEAVRAEYLRTAEELIRRLGGADGEERKNTE